MFSVTLDTIFSLPFKPGYFAVTLFLVYATDTYDIWVSKQLIY